MLFANIVLVIVLIVNFVRGNENKKADIQNDWVISESTDKELIMSNQHPRIFDEITSSKTYVDGMNDDRVNIVYTEHGQTRTLDGEKPYEQAIVTYHRSSTYFDYLGRFEVNIKDSDFATNMTIDQAVEIAVSYLPENLSDIYKCDSAYIYETEKAVVYTYAMRLTSAGTDFSNNGNEQFSYYLSLYITDFKEENRWLISSDYAAYGDRDLEWIEESAELWDIDIIGD